MLNKCYFFRYPAPWSQTKEEPPPPPPRCGPKLADKLGVPGARPRPEPDGRAVSPGASAVLSPGMKPAADSGPSEKKTCGASVWSYFLTVTQKSRVPSRKPFKAIPRLLAKNKLHAGSSDEEKKKKEKEKKEKKKWANSYPVSSSLASIARGRAESTHREKALHQHF